MFLIIPAIAMCKYGFKRALPALIIVSTLTALSAYWFNGLAS